MKAGSKNLLVASSLVACILAAYATSFDAGFVYDDKGAIVDNPHIRSLWPLTDAMSIPLWDSGTALDRRPGLSLTFALNYAFGQLDPSGYRAVNVLIHILCAVLAWLVTRTALLRVGRPPAQADGLAFGAALLWGVHPLNTESVTYIVQRAESLAALLSLFAVYGAQRYFHASGPHRVRAAWAVLSCLCCLVGVTVKETVFAAPPIVLAYDRVFVSGTWLELVRRHWRVYAGYLLSWVLLAWLVANTMGGDNDFMDRSVPRYLFTQPGVILYYLRLAAWPHPLVMNYDWAYADTLWRIVPPLLAVGALGLLTVWGIAKRLPISFAGAVFFLALAPSSSFAALQQRIEEHRMYLPLLPVVALFVLGLDRAARKWMGTGTRRARQVCVGAVAAIALLFGGMTAARNADYAGSETLWASNVRHRPQSAWANLFYANALHAAGKVDAAREHYEEAARLSPGLGAANYHLGLARYDEGRFADAIDYFERALSEEKGNIREAAYHNMALALSRIGRTNRAEQAFRASLDINPDGVPSLVNLGLLLVGMGRNREARQVFARLQSVRPDDPQAYRFEGDTWMAEGRFEEARRAYIQAVRVARERPDLHVCVGAAMYEGGHSEDALRAFSHALRLDPAYVPALRNRAKVLLARGDTNGAARDLTAALKVRPDDPATRAQLGKVLLGIRGREASGRALLREAARSAAQNGNDLLRREIERTLAKP